MEEIPRDTGSPSGYHSYLLRLWRGGEGAVGWQASLHDPHTGERVGFASLDELFGYLREQIGVVPGTNGGPRGG